MYIQCWEDQHGLIYSIYSFYFSITVNTTGEVRLSLLPNDIHVTPVDIIGLHYGSEMETPIIPILQVNICMQYLFKMVSLSIFTLLSTIWNYYLRFWWWVVLRFEKSMEYYCFIAPSPYTTVYLSYKSNVYWLKLYNAISITNNSKIVRT